MDTELDVKARYERYFVERLTAVTAKVPENLRGLVPDLADPLDKLAWIERALESGFFAPRSASVTDAGQPETPPMTEAQKREKAGQLGVDWRYLPD